jgi:RNA polymerase sigma-54 factor
VIYKNLLLQLKHKTPSESVELATDISKINLMPYKKALREINPKYNVSNEQLKKAINEIENPTWCFYRKQ